MFEKFKQQAPRRTAAILTAAAIAMAPVVAGCGGSDSGTEPASTTKTALNGDVYSAADVAFAQQMIPHHAQAIEMVDLVRGRSLSPEVEQLAAQIMEAQTPEIETMTDWLTAWEEEVPPTSRDHANAEGGHDMDDLNDDMPGMMSQEQIEALESAPDAEFEDMWLEMMVEHHEGAIEMARTEQEGGEFADAVAMAQDIEAGQTAEISKMNGLLGG